MRNRENFLIFGYVFLQLGQGLPNLLRLTLVVFSISCEEVVDLLLRKIFHQIFPVLTLWEELHFAVTPESCHVIDKPIGMDLAIFSSASHVS